MGKLEAALDTHARSLEMSRAIHKDEPHPSIAASLNNLGSAYHAMGNWKNAREVQTELRNASSYAQGRIAFEHRIVSEQSRKSLSGNGKLENRWRSMKRPWQ